MVSMLFIATLLLVLQTYFREAYGKTPALAVEFTPTRLLALSSEPIQQPELVDALDITLPPSLPNPHWDKTQCDACHKAEIKKGSLSLLADDDALCLKCHKEDVVHIYIHPVGGQLPKKRLTTIRERWGEELHLDGNRRVTCLTCHDPLDQCLAQRSHQSKRNPRFLRGGPYPERYTMCYFCHDATKYQRINSHDQIADNGMLKLSKCRYCHVVRSNGPIKTGIERNFEDYPLLPGLNDDRSLLCIRCHRKIDHPSSAFIVRSTKNYRHLVRIEADKKRTLEKQNLETGIKLPLEPNTGRIYCGTCHQPHQPGVFSGENFKTMKMKKHRLRTTPICKHCHDMYGTIMDTGKVK